MTSLEDRAVQAIHEKFDELPKKCKPRPASDSGVAEWVPLSGVALCHNRGDVECVALGTGMKCLPLSKVPTANGNVLHDWHAEVVAMRAFNHFLLRECLRLSSEGNADSKVLVQHQASKNDDDDSRPQPYTIRPDVQILMYCSEAPCGDASMELVMQRQEDATPWPISSTLGGQGGLLGRECFSELGVVRRKPSRGDSPLTISKSCSDKIALKQCTSLLSGLTAQLISPVNAYIDTLILPASQHVETACERCFGADGRMRLLKGRSWPGGYFFRPFRIASTDESFKFSKEAVSSCATDCRGSNVAAAWDIDICETLINGVLQGRKQEDPKGASQLSRKRMFELTRQIVDVVSRSLTPLPVHLSYHRFKTTRAVARSQVKEDAIKGALLGWVKNAVDDFQTSAQ